MPVQPKYPGIVAISPDAAAVVRALTALKEGVEIGQRLRGDPLDSFVRLRELYDYGLIQGTEAPEGAVAWGDITGKPGSFPPSAHTHPWSQITGAPPTYQTQVVASKMWADGDFVRGHNIIGVRYASAAVLLPHDLSVEKIIIVKDELGVGGVVVSVY